jgi:hypothetical protein
MWRQMVVDVMHFSKSIPLVAVERSMPFAELAKARGSHPERPPWGALFAKAFGLVAKEYAALRQTYFSFPFPYLYEYEESAVSIAHEVNLGRTCRPAGAHPQSRQDAFDRISI